MHSKLGNKQRVYLNGVDLDEFDDVLHDTFAPKEKPAEQGEDERNEDAAPAVPDSPVVENEMTFTEQLEFAKEQALKAEKDQKAKAAAVLKRKEDEKKKKERAAKAKKEKEIREQQLIDKANEEAVNEAIDEHE